MSDPISDRRAKLAKIRALGIDPYGGRFTGVTPCAEIRAAGERLGPAPGQVLDGAAAAFRAAGRIVLCRDIGSLIFLTVRDWTGELQFGLSRRLVQGLAPAYSAAWGAPQAPPAPDGATAWKLAKLLDLGDLVGVDGHLGRTQTGELTLWADRLVLLAKALRPPPEKWHGLTDVEARYRRRHVDLASNPDARRVFLQRARIIEYARGVLHRRGFVEVDTPVLQPLYGGAAARPFVTHHRALGLELFLRISPELYLKRCLVGGLERVYELARCFRNEGISPRHNPEFTMLELYQAYGDYHDMMELCEELIGGAAREVIGSLRIRCGEREIDYAPPWPRRRYAELFAEHVGVRPDDRAAVAERARVLGLDPARMDAALVVHKLFEHHVEERLVNPTFVVDWPAALCPLTRRAPGDGQTALRFELFINGLEIANAYSELSDPDVQRTNLAEQLAGEGAETMRVMDEDFIEALECGMPPAGGLGIGIDRLVMLLTGRPSIRDVLLFPLQRPDRSRPDPLTAD